MAFKVKNLLIILGVALLLILAYIIFSGGGSEEEGPLTVEGPVASPGDGTESSQIAGDFLTLLLSVKNISLDTRVLEDPTFATLTDSSIELIQEGNEGRTNPFAPLGSDL